MKSFIRVMQDIALMVLRIVVGVTMMARGWYRWQIEGVPGQTSYLEHLGVPYAPTLVWLTIGFEIIGGLLLVFGLATPLIGLALIVLNVGIIVLTRWDTFYVHEHGWEYNGVLAAVGMVLLCFGSGRAGLDSLFVRPKEDRGSDLIAEPSEADRIRSGKF